MAKAKSLMDQIVLPAPLAPFATGNAKADAALAKLSTWEHSSANPFPTPGGKDYAAAIKAARTAGVPALTKLLDDATLTIGSTEWDDDAYDAMRPNDKKAFRKAYDAANELIAIRSAYVHTLIGMCLPDPAARDRLLAVATDAKRPTRVRRLAADMLAEKLEDTADQLRVARALDPHKWDGKWNKSGPDRIYLDGAYLWLAADPKGAYDALHDLVDKAIAKPKDKAAIARAECVVFALRTEGMEYDPRWAAKIAPLVATSADVVTYTALANLPPDPVVIPTILKALGGKPEKVSYWYDNCVKTLARVATPELVPWLAAALADSWMVYADVFDGLARAKSPAGIPVIEAWLVENGDGPKGDRTKHGARVIKALKKYGPAPAAAPTPSAEDDDEDAPRKRPTLVFKKIKKPRIEKIDPIATQEKIVKQMFANAGIPDAQAKIVQRAVYLQPTRVEESTLALGTTKLGGHPDLPDGTAWPRVKKAPLTFVAQLAFAELAPHLPKNSPLPKTGTLAIFVANDPMLEDDGPEYLSVARAIYTKPNTKLVRHEVPDDFVDRIYQACRCDLAATLSLPSPSNRHVTKALDKKTAAIYEEDVYVEGKGLPQVMGYRLHGYDAEEPATAQMLLQLTGDDQSDMEFGDADYLSFFIDEKKLAAGDFSKIWPHCGD